MLQAIGHAIDNLFANPGYGEQKKKNAREEHHRQSRTPGHTHVDAHGISEIGVQRHSRRQGYGIIRIQSHHQRGNRGGNAGCKYHAVARHPGLSENLRVHHDDVGHRHKRGETAQHLLFHGGLMLGKFEIAIDQSFTWAEIGRLQRRS